MSRRVFVDFEQSKKASDILGKMIDDIRDMKAEAEAADREVSGLTYAKCSADAAIYEANNTLNRLEAFKEALDQYIIDVKKTDQDFAARFRALSRKSGSFQSNVNDNPLTGGAPSATSVRGLSGAALRSEQKIADIHATEEERKLQAMIKYFAKFDSRYPGLGKILINPYGSLYLNPGTKDMALKYLEDRMKESGGSLDLSYMDWENYRSHDIGNMSGSELSEYLTLSAFEKLVALGLLTDTVNYSQNLRIIVASTTPELHNKIDHNLMLEANIFEFLKIRGTVYQSQVDKGGLAYSNEKNKEMKALESGFYTSMAYSVIAFDGTMKSQIRSTGDISSAQKLYGDPLTEFGSQENSTKYSIKTLEYKTTSGVVLKTDPNLTTTILGTYKSDTGSILKELGNEKSVDFGPRQGDFNLLNTPDELYKNPDQFWSEYNKPWLDNVIERGDNITLATEPINENLYRYDKVTGMNVTTGFGREYEYLLDNGYIYDDINKQMILP